MAWFSTAIILAKQQFFSFHCLTLIKNRRPQCHPKGAKDQSQTLTPWARASAPEASPIQPGHPRKCPSHPGKLAFSFSPSWPGRLLAGRGWPFLLQKSWTIIINPVFLSLKGSQDILKVLQDRFELMRVSSHPQRFNFRPTLSLNALMCQGCLFSRNITLMIHISSPSQLGQKKKKERPTRMITLVIYDCITSHSNYSQTWWLKGKKATISL